MTDDALAARNPTDAATPALSDLREDHRVRAGAVAWTSPDVVMGWHRHPYHQLEYALTGVIQVECDDGHYLLPPQEAIWIPAGIAHTSTLRAVRSVSLFLHPDDVPGTWDRAQVLAVAPVLREVMAYAVRWPIGRAHVHDAFADSVFAVATRLVLDALDRELPYRLPTSRDPLVRSAIEATMARLPTATAPAVCRAVGVSPRTLRRRFLASTGMTWSDFVAKARLMRAMSLLATTDRSVLDIATAVGFLSPSGFTRAFRTLTGASPAAYRRRRRPPV
jgi:AraC-like DNA-binding protein